MTYRVLSTICKPIPIIFILYRHYQPFSLLFPLVFLPPLPLPFQIRPLHLQHHCLHQNHALLLPDSLVPHLTPRPLPRFYSSASLPLSKLSLLQLYAFYLVELHPRYHHCHLHLYRLFQPRYSCHSCCSL